MSLDLSKLTDAVAKVADLAKAHADISALVASANAARDAAVADLVQAQKDVDALVAQLLAAAKTPAETAGLTAVAAAILAPSPAPVAPVVFDTSVVPPAAPVAPAAPVVTATYLPGDPRANAH
ncbi:hypothetical protein [Bradyrhizobium sp. USDA 4350]